VSKSKTNLESADTAEPKGALAYFEYLKSIGVEYVEKSKPCLLSEVKADNRSGVLKLSLEVKECKACELYKTRTQTVFGSGSFKAGIMFVGEAPGADEDKQGLPFVGRAGKLLTKMIEAIGYSRDEVYIANVLKCRPPDNRPPKPDEKDACEHFLIEQIKMIKPSIICTLGAHSAQTLLKTDVTIGKLRGKFHDYHGVPLMPTYHPSFLLRSPQNKKSAWEDLKMLRDRYKKIVG